MAPKLKIAIPPGRWPGWWDALAADVLPFYAADRGAFVWPEAEAALAESSWVHQHCDPDFPPKWHIDSHHLKRARRALAPDTIMPMSEILNGREVVAWVDTRSVSVRGDKTRILALAGEKRRAYRSFLGWTGDHKLCGDVGEQVVGDVLAALRGSSVWTPKGMTLGKVDSIQGRPIQVGGPLDASGEWPLDPNRLAAGATPFAVEVKNVRSILYPYDHDVWDLLAKMAAFPDVLPVFVARRCHWTTFRMFKDIGVLGTETYRQFFSDRIDEDTFDEVTRRIGLPDAVQYDGVVPKGLITLFGTTGPRLGQDQLEKWRQVAPIAANYPELRDDGLDEASRSELFNEFANEVNGTGLYNGGWAAVFDDEEDIGSYDGDDI